MCSATRPPYYLLLSVTFSLRLFRAAIFTTTAISARCSQLITFTLLRRDCSTTRRSLLLVLPHFPLKTSNSCLVLYVSPRHHVANRLTPQNLSNRQLWLFNAEHSTTSSPPNTFLEENPPRPVFFVLCLDLGAPAFFSRLLSSPSRLVQ